MTSPLNAARTLWLALHAPPHSYADSDQAMDWLRPVFSESQDPNLVHQGATPLLVWMQHLNNVPEAASHVSDIMVRVTEALMEQGANPWLPIVGPTPRQSQRGMAWEQQGLAPFMSVLHARAAVRQPIMDLLLNHPARPEWTKLLALRPHMYGQGDLFESLGLYPWLVPVMAKHGWNPNTVDAHGRNAAFYLNTVADWEDATKAGVLFSQHDNDGQNVLAWQEKRQKLTQEQRAWLVEAMGPKQVDDAQIWTQALSGKVSQLAPVLPESKRQAEWRWRSPGKDLELNLLDAASLAALRPGATRKRQVKPETSLLQRLLKLKCIWPESSLNLAQLALAVTGKASDDGSYVLGLERCGALASSHNETIAWSRLWTLARSEAEQQATRAAWMAFMMADPQRWSENQHGPGGTVPVGYSGGSPEGEARNLKLALTHPQQHFTPGQRVVVMAHNILVAQNEAANTARALSHRQQCKAYVNHCLPLLLEAMAPLGSDHPLRAMTQRAMQEHAHLAAVCLADNRRAAAVPARGTALPQRRPRSRC